MTFTVSVAQDIDSFDRGAFRTKLASILNVGRQNILLDVVGASVTVTATIYATSDESAGTIASTLSSEDTSSLSTVLGVVRELAPAAARCASL